MIILHIVNKKSSIFLYYWRQPYTDTSTLPSTEQLDDLLKLLPGKLICISEKIRDTVVMASTVVKKIKKRLAFFLSILNPNHYFSRQNDEVCSSVEFRFQKPTHQSNVSFTPIIKKKKAIFSPKDATTPAMPLIDKLLQLHKIKINC